MSFEGEEEFKIAQGLQKLPRNEQSVNVSILFKS